MVLPGDKVVFPELSYDIVGAGFKVFNELGWGLSEKHYQRALAFELEKRGIKFQREVSVPLRYNSKVLTHYFADFVVESKVLLELKVVSKLGYAHADQLLGYLRSGGYKLGILLYFTKDGVKYRRVLNSRV